MNTNTTSNFGQEPNNSSQISNLPSDFPTFPNNNQQIHNTILTSQTSTQSTHIWKIATRNIQGLTDDTKRNLWFDYCKSKQ